MICHHQRRLQAPTRNMTILLLVLLGLGLQAQARSADLSAPKNTLDESQQPQPQQPQQQNPQQQQARSAASGAAGILGELRSVYQMYKDCAGAEVSSCLKLKLLATMDRVSRSQQLNILDGVSLVRDDETPQQEPPQRSPQEIEASLPRSLEDREDALNTMIAEKALGFLQSHTLKVKLPSVAEEMQRSLVEEGRKKKKGGGLLAIPLLIGGTLIPLALGTLALLAGKALIISKLALVLASIIGLKKLLSHHDHGHEVVQVGHGGGGWARSGQEMAYSAYKPVVAQPAQRR